MRQKLVDPALLTFAIQDRHKRLEGVLVNQDLTQEQIFLSVSVRMDINDEAVKLHVETGWEFPL